MIDKPVRSSLLPDEDDSLDKPVVVSGADHALTPVGRTMVVASVLLTAWSGLLLALVAVNAISVIPALVLFALAFIVLAVEVSRARASGRSRNRFGILTAGVIAPDDLRGLLEIERSSVAEERRVLLARELSRLASEALLPNPVERATWPTPEQFASLRAQIAMLRASATDPSTRMLPIGSPVGHLTDADLTDAIQALGDYIGHLSRMQNLNVDDPEQLRVLVRDQSRLRTVQDKVVGQLQEPAIIAPTE